MSVPRKKTGSFYKGSISRRQGGPYKGSEHISADRLFGRPRRAEFIAACALKDTLPAVWRRHGRLYFIKILKQVASERNGSARPMPQSKIVPRTWFTAVPALKNTH